MRRQKKSCSKRYSSKPVNSRRLLRALAIAPARAAQCQLRLKKHIDRVEMLNTQMFVKPIDRNLCICYITGILNIGLIWGTDYFMVPMRNDKEKIINNMQKNLRLVRHAAGWSAQELGELIGVTRQTINNIENHKTPMSTTQYVALCAMLDIRINEKPDLKYVIEAVLKMTDKDDLKIKDSNNELLTSNEKNGNSVSVMKGVFGSMSIGAGSGFLNNWISKIKE